MTLSTEDQSHLNAAEGYGGLGMWLDANAELEGIDADMRHLPEVLQVRLAIVQGLKR